MRLTRQNMIVGRDRAHVRNLLAAHPQQEVVSASQFFDKIRLLAFINQKGLSRDDYAPFIFAQRLLQQQQNYPVRLAKNFAAIYSACFHGVARPGDVLRVLLPEHEKYRTIFSILQQIDEEMTARGLATGVTSLFLAHDFLKRKRMLPPHFVSLDGVSLFHLVDLTMLEIEVIKELSRLGLAIDIKMPLDFAKRGINSAVDFSASLFEQDADLVNIELAFEKIAGVGPLASLVDHLFTDERIIISGNSCSIEMVHSLSKEADHVSEKIIKLQEKNSNESIAVVMRTMDTRAEIFKQSLKRHDISVRDRKGISLVKTSAGNLLITLFSARLWGLPKIDLVGLMSHPLFSQYIADGLLRSRLLKLVDDLGIDNRIVPHRQSLHHYRARIARLQKTSPKQDDEKNYLDVLLAWLSQVYEMLALLEDNAGLKDFLNVVIDLIQRAMLPDDAAVMALKNSLLTIVQSQAFSDDDPVLTLHDFINWLKTELAALTMPRPDNLEFNAVEFLLLPELLGRHFDHVFIADMAFGRLPQVSSPDALLDDLDRANLNRLMKKPLLRVFFDDPFEPMPTPPRQALEPFWFAAAVASATCIHFSTALRDDKGQEQAPSEFFTWLLDHVSVEKEPVVDHFGCKSLQHRRLAQGLIDRQTISSAGPWQMAIDERRRGFHDGVVGEFFFALDKSIVKEAFAGRIDANPTRALSPTMIEAFVECRLRGFLLRILGWERLVPDADDMDARSIGQIAHRVLERFFDDGQTASLPNQEMYKKLRSILDEVVKEYVANFYVGNPGILVCHQEWLFDTLSTLIIHLEHNRRQNGAKTVLKEIDMGILGAFKPLTLRTQNQQYLVGGRIDRIDEYQDGFLIIDYKLSSSNGLRGQLSPKNLLKGNFQAPVYLRLVAKHLAKDDRRKAAFAFASIRDGEMVAPLTYENNVALYERIFNDDAPDSLAQEINNVFAPIIRGEISAHHGDHCAYCDFAFFCRKGESARYGH